MRRTPLFHGLAIALALGACATQQEANVPAQALAFDREQLCAKRSAPLASAPPQSQAPPLAPIAPPAPSTAWNPPTAPALPAPTGTIAASSQARSIRVHFPGPDEPFRDCLAHPWVVRTVPAKVNPVEFALRAVIAGPTPFEEQQGLSSPYRHSTSDPGAQPLSPSQVTVKVKDGVAIVDFAQGASPYLMQAICARSAVTSAIENTLLQFQEIRSVAFAIGGVVIEEWDA